MGHGGRRPGAGRKPGSGTKKTREHAEALLGDGVTPLDYIVGCMRGTMVYDDQKFEAAKAAAPYMHARLAAVEHKGEMTTTYVMQAPAVSETAEDWAKTHGHAVTH